MVDRASFQTYVERSAFVGKEAAVARGNKLGGSAAPAEKPEALLQTVIEAVIEASALSFSDWSALSPNALVPLAIPVSAGGQYRVTQAGVDAAHVLTEQVWKARPDLRQTITREKFNRLSFTAIGDAIANSRSHLDPTEDPPGDRFYAAIAKDFQTNLDALANSARGDVDRHIPCHLFDLDQGVAEFTVGPVAFLPRAAWLTRFVINPIQLGHIQEVEDRTVTYEDLRQRALAVGAPRDLRDAWSILKTLRNFTWVATLRVSGHELDQSHRKASVIIGLAIDAVGSRFPVEAARRFTRMGRQHLYSEERLASTPDGRFLNGWSIRMPGLGARPGALRAKMAAEQPFLDDAGEIFSAYMTGRQTGSAPHLVERWMNALYWFGEARREASDFMAVVDYGCAVDGLSGAGGSAKEMGEFAKAALDPKGQPTPAGSLSVSAAVDRLYVEGRNKLAHGETPGLLEDLSELRAIGDDLLAKLFDVVTVELADFIRNKPQYLTVSEDHAIRALRTRLEQRP
ncbi:hypothetical protein [Methylobacterium sp. J-068]|uniref:hypothetical protein n=1 Tax=Methylobacterium sp. J-068 TaxID=2836649 RepID=UPI001FB9B4D5|nr:hypothetical protein [Methylobacterium sp. J-068]MCJ2036135.1 hypothetical protein [Methylobacterium sp. J-068]